MSDSRFVEKCTQADFVHSQDKMIEYFKIVFLNVYVSAYHAHSHKSSNIYSIIAIKEEMTNTTLQL